MRLERKSNMDLWVRSQDKMDIMKVESLHIDEIPTFDDVNIICYASGNKYSNIGNYKNKKRALEVLDEIEDLMRSLCDSNLKMIRYEMPKE